MNLKMLFLLPEYISREADTHSIIFKTLLIYSLTWITLHSDGSGSKFFDPGWVSHLWIGFGFGKFNLKIPNFQFFPLRVKKISLGWVKKYLGQRQVSLLFTAGQKYDP